MKKGETFFARDREEWRKWLSTHHDEKKEVWLVLYKKHIEEECVSYDDAVEEAVCFGWIDGTLNRIDDTSHMIRFTPRKSSSIWAGSNLDRARRMIDQGKMTEAGFKAYNARDHTYIPPSVNYGGRKVKVPDHFEKELRSDPSVWERFRSFPPSHKNQYIGWIEMAKKEETKRRRAKKAVEIIRKEITGEA
ncbi:MAG: YdeI/OmpD-associated family protein [Thermoplasmatota archaeon]